MTNYENLNITNILENSTLETIITDYNQIDNLEDSNKYPDYLLDHIWKLVSEKLVDASINDVLDIISKLMDQGIKIQGINIILANIIKKSKEHNYLSFTNCNNDKIGEFVDNFLDKYDKTKILKSFIRFIILNLIQSVYDQEYITQIYFVFRMNNEIQISSYIHKKYDFDLYYYIGEFSDSDLDSLELIYLYLINI